MRTLTSLLAAALLACASALPTAASAQTADADFTFTRVVDASSDDVWGVLRDLDNIDELSKFVARVEYTGENGVGGTRVCYAPEGDGFYKESIVGFDDAGRSYRYAVTEGVPASGMVNGFKVVDLGYRKSMIVWTSSYDAFVDNPRMTEEQFRGFIESAIADMLDNVVAKAKA